MHDVKQGAGTLVCRQLVDKDGTIQKFASQETKEHRQLVEQDSKYWNWKATGQRAHAQRKLFDWDSKNQKYASQGTHHTP